MGEVLHKGLTKVYDVSLPYYQRATCASMVTTSGLQKPFTKCEPRVIIPCDEWIPNPEDLLFKHIKNAIILPVSAYYGVTDDTEFDYFHLDIKQRCYNSDKMREHCTHYLNYFEKFYDTDHELISIYYKIKYLIDYQPTAYNDVSFVMDIRKYILGPSMRYKVSNMNIDNYSLDLQYKNNKNPCLQYTNNHAMMLMEISIFMNMVIPLLTHFIYKHQKDLPIKDFLLYVFNIIIDQYSDRADFYSKLYETAITNINKSRDNHRVLWDKQPIRGKSPAIHSDYTINNIILQIIPKYTYNQNMIHSNNRVLRVA